MSIEKAVSEQVRQSVETTVRVQIAEALSRDPAALIRAVVDEAMSEKKGYSRETVFQAAVNKMIREAAQEEFKLWLDEKRPLIRKAIQARMKKEGGGFIEDVADRIVDGMSKSFYATIRLKVEDED